MTILHFCPVADWQAAVVSGQYTADTLATEGFIHCSTADLVHIPANQLARGRTDLVLLEIDEDRLTEPPRYEPGEPDVTALFPHVYGPIPVAAVVAVHDFPPGADGRFRLPDSFTGEDPGVTRIVAGVLGGRRLAAPAGQQTRPTSERVREALFSTIASMTELDGCRFVDLYAGSGAVGLEAASRGAAAVLLVESEARASRTLRDNIGALGLTATCQLSSAQVGTVLASPPATPFDVVFADPPYQVDDDEIEAVLVALVDRDWLADDAVVAVERSRRSPEPRRPEGITPERGRRYGDTALWYGRRLTRAFGREDGQ